MNLKTKLLFSFLMIGSLLLVNCQVEDLQESASKRNPYAPIVSKEFKEFEKLPGLLSEIIPNHGLSIRKKNTDPRYQFEIDSTAVIQITNNGIAYYTMSITRENQEDGVFENLVVFDDGNEKKAIIVKYKPDASFLSRFELNPDAQFSGKFNMTELERSNLASRLTSATKCFISTHLYCTNNNPPTLAGKGCYTNKDGGAHVKSITSVNCFEIIINEPEPYLNNTFVLNPINDAGGGNPDIATSIATHPVFMGIIDFRFIRKLTPEQKAWWNNASNNAAVAVILNYLKENTSNHSYVNNQLILDGDISSEAKIFGRWAIDYLRTHPSITIGKFQNWFMVPDEGRDFLYDENFWENPNLNFPQQDLPSWDDFENAYPSESSSQLYGVVGDEVAKAQIDYPEATVNGCALKVSRALNYSGVIIPRIITSNGYPGTLKGADGKYYFLNAKSLNKWMRETFGTNPTTNSTPLNENHYHFTADDGGSNGENFPTLVDGKKGIFSMVSTNPQWSSGHADIINDDGNL
jgi:hypothetical protein